jgi:predicted N-acetyltransferase YhbS
MKLRPETAADRSAIATLIARTYLASGARLIEMTGLLRDLPQYKPELGVLAEIPEHEAPVAYALFTPVTVGGKDGAVLLAPLAMDTDQPDLDYNAFLHLAIDHVRALGYKAVLMHGVADMYAEDGFEAASAHGIKGGISYPGADLLLKPLGAFGLKGEVAYPSFLARF